MNPENSMSHTGGGQDVIKYGEGDVHVISGCTE